MYEMLELTEKTLLLGTLFLCSWIDVKEQKVYLIIPEIAGAIGLLFHIVMQNISIWNLLAGASIGGVLFLIGYLSKESVGYGDAAIVLMTGVYLGFWNNLQLLIGALMIAGVAGLLLLILKKKNRKDRIPMIPFVLLAYVMGML